MRERDKGRGRDSGRRGGWFLPTCTELHGTATLKGHGSGECFRMVGLYEAWRTLMNSNTGIGAGGRPLELWSGRKFPSGENLFLLLRLQSHMGMSSPVGVPPLFAYSFQDFLDILGSHVTFLVSAAACLVSS